MRFTLRTYFYCFSLVTVVAAVYSLPGSIAASSIDNVLLTQGSFDNTSDAIPPGLPEGDTRIPDFLGGSSTVGFGTDVANERRLAMNTIPSVWDWAYWDPTGLGANPETGGPYHAGRQVQWESLFSTPSADGVSAPNGTIAPADLDSLGAQWLLDTGAELAQSGQGRFRITDSGRVGVRIDPTSEGGVVDGQKFHLEMTIPDGEYRVSLFMENRTRNALATVNFPGVDEIGVDPIGDSGDDEFALQFDVLNDSGSSQVLSFDIGDLDNTIDDLDVRFTAAAIQSLPIIPEPSSVVLGLLGVGLLALRLRK